MKRRLEATAREARVGPPPLRIRGVYSFIDVVKFSSESISNRRCAAFIEADSTVQSADGGPQIKGTRDVKLKDLTDLDGHHARHSFT